MALNVVVEAPSGATASYWLVLQVTVNFHAGFGSIDLGGWVDQAAHDAGKPPLDSRHIPLTDETIVTPYFGKESVRAAGPPLTRAYAYVVALAELDGLPNPFFGATDV